MCQSEKQKSSAETAAQSAQDTARSEGKRAEETIIKAGQPTAQESQLQSRYMTKSQQQPESLLTEAGPVSQAVAQRILERVNQPGLDYDTNSKDFETAVGTPVWASLKARGITPAPGDTTGGGLGTTQYMKTVVPYLAEQRSNQINTDLSRGQTWNTSALSQQNYYTNLADAISQALGLRNLQATETGVPMRVSGMNNAEAINQQWVNQQNTQKSADNAAIAKLVGTIIAGAATGGMGAGALGLSMGAGAGLGALGGLGTGMSGGDSGSTNALQLAALLRQQNTGTSTPASNQLSYRLQAPAARQTAGYM